MILICSDAFSRFSSQPFVCVCLLFSQMSKSMTCTSICCQRFPTLFVKKMSENIQNLILISCSVVLSIENAFVGKQNMIMCLFELCSFSLICNSISQIVLISAKAISSHIDETIDREHSYDRRERNSLSTDRFSEKRVLRIHDDLFLNLYSENIASFSISMWRLICILFRCLFLKEYLL